MNLLSVVCCVGATIVNLYFAYSFWTLLLIKNPGSTAVLERFTQSADEKSQHSYYSEQTNYGVNFLSVYESSFWSKDAVTVIVLAGKIGEFHPGYHNFLKSLEFTGFSDVKVIQPSSGLQEILTLKITNQSAESLFWVRRLAQFESVSQTFERDHILLFCDAFDVYFGLPPQILVNRFKRMNAPVVFSTEMLCDTISCRTDFDVTEWFEQQATAKNISSPYKFLNAGMFIGFTYAIQQVLKCAVGYALAGRDDQTAFSMCYRDAPELIALDYHSVLFGNFPPFDPIFNSAWQSRDIEHIGTTGQTDETSNLPASWVQLLNVGPLVHRKARPPVSPVAFHFPGIAYRPRTEIPFNPCQQNLRWRYNDIGKISFENAVRPFLFHPVPNQKLREVLGPVRIVVAITARLGLGVDSGVSALNDLLEQLRDISAQTWSANLVYLHLQQYEPAETTERLVVELQQTGASITMESGLTGSAVLDAVQSETEASTVIVLLQAAVAYDRRTVETLAARVMRNPVNAYCLGGRAIVRHERGRPVADPDLTIAVTTNLRHFPRKSVSVDVLDSEYGAAFQRHLLDVRRLSGYAKSIPRACGGLDHVWLSAYLSQNGLPRIQITTALDSPLRFGDFRQSRSDHSDLRRFDDVSGDLPQRTSVDSKLRSCVSGLATHFRVSWTRSMAYKESRPEGSFDQQPHFETIPPVPELRGFSWQPNWDIRSHTCPCTVHLMTRVSSEGQPMYLGEGQYLGQGQSLWSPSKRHRLTLLPGPHICAFSGDTEQRCVDMLSGDISVSYAAIVQGDLCVFEGKSPHFGGTRAESGHRKQIWNSSSHLANRNRAPVPQSKLGDVYLHVNDKGDFGLFLGGKSAHDMLSPTERVKHFKLLLKL